MPAAPPRYLDFAPGGGGEQHGDGESGHHAASPRLAGLRGRRISAWRGAGEIRTRRAPLERRGQDRTRAVVRITGSHAVAFAREPGHGVAWTGVSEVGEPAASCRETLDSQGWRKRHRRGLRQGVTASVTPACICLRYF